MIVENKICILINWSREIDMYIDLINLIPEENIDIIVNDIKTIERERKENSKDIEKNLLAKKIKFKYFSKIYKKKKYKIILSTGLASTQKISLYSMLRFFYGKIIGRFLDISGISEIFLKLFNRPFNAGGKYCRIGLMWYPEKKIGEKVVRYPTGTDLKLRYYPDKDLGKNFDIFFTHSSMEAELILKKFSNKICKIIGYPRYNELKEKEEILYNIKKEFNIYKEKKIIFWTPTHIHYPDETSKNFIPWIEKISFLNKKYNIIVRPHPKLIKINDKIKNNLEKKGFFVDDKLDRKIGDLFKVSDLVLCDYGESLFSAIYLEKPMVLLNIGKNLQYYKDLEFNLSLDHKLRNDLINYNTIADINELEKGIFNSLSTEYSKKILNLKKLFFGNLNDYNSPRDITNYIQSFLK